MKDRLRENLLDARKEGTLNPVEWLEKRREAVMDLAECGVSSAMELWRRLDEEIKFFLTANELKVELKPNKTTWGGIELKPVPLLDYKLQDIPSDAEHMTFKEFVSLCEDGSLIDRDGFGLYATATKVSNTIVYPSEIIAGRWELRFTHVVWYKR
jgi:hypothetical protein